MTDLTAKLREALPCVCSQSTYRKPRGRHFDHCPAQHLAKVEAVVREMVAKVPHLIDEGITEMDQQCLTACEAFHGDHNATICMQLGGQCAFGGEKGTNNG